MAPVYHEDGVRYVECDGCGCEVRTAPNHVGLKVYHPGCTPS